MSEAKLFVVAMPIGNVGDLTQRARDILQGVAVIACEDTRKTIEVLKRSGISTTAKIISHHSHNQQQSTGGVIQMLLEGKSVALVSDAGTPRVSDPGAPLIKACYQHHIPVIPLPGASAITTLTSVAPFAIEPLLFLGFLSPKSGRRKNELEKYHNFEGCVVLFESVYRICPLLKDILDVYGDIEVFIGREMTKTYEEYFSGTVEMALAWAAGKKGEFSLALNLRNSAKLPQAGS